MNEIMFYVNSILLGIGLAMDAFSVSLADGLSEPKMKNSKMSFIAGLFAFFQALMPMIGWICVHTVVKYFEKLQILIPFIALGLLSYIGVKMLIDGIKNKECESECCKLCIKALLIQAIGAERIEALCDEFCRETSEALEKNGFSVKKRISPGYGKFPLSAQKTLFSFMDFRGKIGLTLNESLIMSPTKSVTAIFGFVKAL